MAAWLKRTWPDLLPWHRLLLRFVLANWRVNRRDWRRRQTTLARHCSVVWRSN